jgi:streptogramin lyase
MPFGIVAALLAVIVLALPALASADPLGSSTIYKTGLRSTAFPINITAGPDGNVWFNDYKLFSSGVAAMGRVKPSGEITEFLQNADAAPKLTGLNAGSEPIAVATGPDGKLWFTDRSLSAPAIGVINPASPETAEEFSIEGNGGNEGSNPQGIVAGPDGNLWFADASEEKPAIGMINPTTHVVKEFSIGLNAGSRPKGIVAGSDGNLWFTDPGEITPAIGKINPSTHVIEEFATPGSAPGGGNSNVGPWGIALGADGNVWFTENGTKRAICSITPSGTIECFEAGLAASSHPTGLTAAPDGKLWFTDESSVPEQQELKIEDSGTLGGTYKLAYKGNETGATGSGNLLSGATGKGDVKRYPATGNATCKRTTGSKILKACNNSPSVNAEVGMRINGTGIPVETVITKIEGESIFISNAVTGAALETNTTNVNAGRIVNVTTETGKFETGQTIKGTGISSSAIIAVGEKEGKGTITPANVPTAVGTNVSLTGSTTTVVTNVKTSTGAFSVGEQITGTGIPAGTTITEINTNTKSLTLSATPAAGTEVSLSADLRFDATASAVAGAVEKLSGIGTGPGTPNVAVSGSGSTSPVTRTLFFEEGLAGVDVEQLSCNGAGLTGTSPTCNVSTVKTAVPSAVGSITTSGKITRYPSESFGNPVQAITAGPDGNLWFPAGTRGNAKIVKFGIEPVQLTVNKTGKGSGTVTSSPEGINCGSECSAGYAQGTEVTLTAAAAIGSEFSGWSGSGCSGTGTCKVTMSEAKSVTAEFAKTSNRRTLTITKAAGGTGGIGTVSSKPKGIKCGGACNKAVASMYKNSSVELSAKPSTGSTFSGWVGCDSVNEGKCIVSMTAAKSVEALFGPTSKAILSPTALTLSKGESTGTGTVKASGLACEAECTETVVLYQGEYESKPGVFKAAKTVELSATSAFGSTFTGWSGSGCSGTGTCTVTMSAAKSVTATFTAKPNVTLTVTKNTEEGNYTSGTGTVTSKPKAIKCATTCITQSAAIPQGESVLLSAKPATGMLFVEWEGGGCGVSPTCTVTMSSSKTVTAKFTGSPKLIANEQKLTLNKAGSGFGNVKASGLACEALCTSATSLYQGEYESKPAVFKPAKIVVLSAVSAPGSKPVAWSGCAAEPEPEPGNVECEVSMATAHSVTATFNELE